MRLWAQAFEIARVDFQLERRAGDSLRIVLPFAIVSLLIVPLALGPRLNIVSEIGLAVFWSLGVLFGMQVHCDNPQRTPGSIGICMPCLASTQRPGSWVEPCREVY